MPQRSARGGGVFIADNKQFLCAAMNIPSDLEMVWLLCRAAPQTVLLGVCYRAPNNNSDFSQNLNDVISQLTRKYPKAHINPFGDFNFPEINWQTLAAVGNREANNFIDMCLNFNLTQVVSEPTRVAGGCANILDLIVTAHPEALSSITYLCGISDHKVIHTNFEFLPTPRQIQSKTVRLYDKGNYEAINHELSQYRTTFETSSHSQSLIDNWSLFKHEGQSTN